MKFQDPYCRVEEHGVDRIYKVYDRVGALMIQTQSRSIARQFLDIAHRGVSAKFLYWMEKWNYQIPRSLVDQLYDDPY